MVRFNGSNYVAASTTEDSSGNLSLGDNKKINFGAGNDLQIYHDGSNSIIKDAGTGDLIIGADSNIVLADSALAEVKALFTTNGAASLYYDNVAKLATTSTGITVTGVVSATSFSGDGSALTGIAGATGGSTDQVFYENDQTVTANYAITTNKNAMTAGPITINSGVTVTIPTGSEWSIV